MKLAAYLAHIRRADGTWAADWAIVRLTLVLTREVLRQHMAHAAISQELTEQVHAASEDLRQAVSAPTDWQEVQAQILRVVPVAQRLLRVIAALEDPA